MSGANILFSTLWLCSPVGETDGIPRQGSTAPQGDGLQLKHVVVGLGEGSKWASGALSWEILYYEYMSYECMYCEIESDEGNKDCPQNHEDMKYLSRGIINTLKTRHLPVSNMNTSAFLGSVRQVKARFKPLYSQFQFRVLLLQPSFFRGIYCRLVLMYLSLFVPANGMDWFAI